MSSWLGEYSSSRRQTPAKPSSILSITCQPHRICAIRWRLRVGWCSAHSEWLQRAQPARSADREDSVACCMRLVACRILLVAKCTFLGADATHLDQAREGVQLLQPLKSSLKPRNSLRRRDVPDPQRNATRNAAQHSAQATQRNAQRYPTHRYTTQRATQRNAQGNATPD